MILLYKTLKSNWKKMEGMPKTEEMEAKKDKNNPCKTVSCWHNLNNLMFTAVYEWINEKVLTILIDNQIKFCLEYNGSHFNLEFYF